MQPVITEFVSYRRILDTVVQRLSGKLFDGPEMARQFNAAEALANKTWDETTPMEDIEGDFMELLIAATAMHHLAEVYRRTGNNDEIAGFCFDTAQVMLGKALELPSLIAIKMANDGASDGDVRTIN